jgi:hypothetical protein
MQYVHFAPSMLPGISLAGSKRTNDTRGAGTVNADLALAAHENYPDRVGVVATGRTRAGRYKSFRRGESRRTDPAAGPGRGRLGTGQGASPLGTSARTSREIPLSILSGATGVLSAHRWDVVLSLERTMAHQRQLTERATSECKLRLRAARYGRRETVRISLRSKRAVFVGRW